MITLELSTLIHRPPAAVFDFVALHFFENLGRFNPALVDVRKLTDGPIAVGTLGREVQRIQGKDVARTFRVAELEAPRLFVIVNDKPEGRERRRSRSDDGGRALTIPSAHRHAAGVRLRAHRRR
jgi:hypothetical protein